MFFRKRADENTIYSHQKVGINISNPDKQFEVKGETRIRNNLYIDESIYLGTNNAKVVVDELQYIESVEIINGGSDYTKGDTLTIPGSVIGGSDGTCVIAETFNSPIVNILESNILEVEPPQIYRMGVK